MKDYKDCSCSKCQEWQIKIHNLEVELSRIEGEWLKHLDQQEEKEEVA